ncbi:hypothetical protein I3843_03G039600 [Carya illinoinensis]|nr:hypothetical protein I3760_03G036400 [Carya illinoinensis]KAG7985692.1 hypothetical protein I3843_03G039600 [Carya illinoinensis]
MIFSVLICSSFLLEKLHLDLLNFSTSVPLSTQSVHCQALSAGGSHGFDIDLQWLLQILKAVLLQWFRY